MPALTHVSASQIKDFRACNRLWYYTRILRQRAPQTEAQSRGTTVHGALEAHLKAGKIEPEIFERAKALGITEKDLSDYVASMAPFVGKPGEGLTEYRDEMPTYPGGPKYVLVVDHAREIQCGEEFIPQIDDLKTTSDFRYCKTPDELAKDVQMISYAMWALLRLYIEKNLPEPNFVSLRHVYVRTRGKRIATARDVLVTPEHVKAGWEDILATVREMEDLSARVQVATQQTQDQLARQAETAVALGGGIDPQDVPATTTDHCSAYGGCFFRSKCFGEVYNADRPFIGLFHKEPKEIVMADSNVIPGTFPAPNGAPAVGGPRMSLADRVKARHAGGAAPAAAPAAASVPVGPPAAASVPVGPPTTVAPVVAAAPAVALVCNVVHAMFPACPCTLVPHTGNHESKAPTGGVIFWSQDGTQFGAGPSTDWKAVVIAPAPAAPVAAPTTASIVATAASTVAAVLPPDAPARTSTPEEVAAANAPKTRKARVAKTDAAPGATTEAPAAQAAAPVPQTGMAAVVATLAAVAAVCKLEELYIDCLVTKGLKEEIGIGADIIALSAAEAAASANVPDYRFIQYNSKPALATVLRSHLDTIPRIVVITSSAPGADVLIEVLTPHAKRVVQALRG
jgi:hypothetical protein